MHPVPGLTRSSRLRPCWWLEEPATFRSDRRTAACVPGNPTSRSKSILGANARDVKRTVSSLTRSLTHQPSTPRTGVGGPRASGKSLTRCGLRRSLSLVSWFGHPMAAGLTPRWNVPCMVPRQGPAASGCRSARAACLLLDTHPLPRPDPTANRRSYFFPRSRSVNR